MPNYFSFCIFPCSLVNQYFQYNLFADFCTSSLCSCLLFRISSEPLPPPPSTTLTFSAFLPTKYFILQNLKVGRLKFSTTVHYRDWDMPSGKALLTHTSQQYTSLLQGLISHPISASLCYSPMLLQTVFGTFYQCYLQKSQFAITGS